MYFDYSDYVRFYGGDRLQQGDFERIGINVCRLLDLFTTGIDNYRKLKEAFPTDADDALAVKLCACRLADLLYSVEQTEKAAAAAKETVATENGVHGKMISSTSAGNESISYVTGTGSTIYDQAATSIGSQRKIIMEIIDVFLSGVTDANGVNLLYMGRYPRV